MRFRDSFNAVQPVITTNQKLWQTSDGNIVNRTAGYHVGTYKTCQDVVNKRYRQLSAEGVIFNNPAEMVKTTFALAKGSYQGTYVGSYPQHLWQTGTIYQWSKDGHEWVGGEERIAPLDIESLKKFASTKALASVKQPDVEGLVILGELKETLAMLKHPLNSLNRALDRMLQEQRNAARYGGKKYKRKHSNGGQIIDAVTGTHLEVIYGVMPLINDVNAVLRALGGRYSKRDTSRGQVSDEEEATFTRPYSQNGCTGTIEGTNTRTVTVRAGLLYETSIPSILDQYGLSLVNVPSTLWELTTLSFVLDWFVNIGDMISALTPRLECDTLAQWITVKDVTVTREVFNPFIGTKNDWLYTGSPAIGTVVVERYNRIPTNLGSEAGFSFRFDLNMSQTLSSLSLITQKLRTLSTGR